MLTLLGVIRAEPDTPYHITKKKTQNEIGSIGFPFFTYLKLKCCPLSGPARHSEKSAISK